MPLDDKDNLCNNLIYFRKKNNLTQLQLSEKLGYSNKNISKWENGEIVPDIFMLNKLAAIYGITLDEFLNGEKENIDERLAEEVVKNTKMKRRIILQSFLLFCFAVCTACVIVSTTIFSTSEFNAFGWIVYLYGGAICFMSMYVYFKAFDKNMLLSIMFLALFMIALSLGIYFSTRCSPWIFLVDIPFAFLIYFFADLLNIIAKYREKDKAQRKRRKEEKSRQKELKDKKGD